LQLQHQSDVCGTVCSIRSSQLRSLPHNSRLLASLGTSVEGRRKARTKLNVQRRNEESREGNAGYMAIGEVETRKKLKRKGNSNSRACNEVAII
jgi:hypothetical protein